MGRPKLTIENIKKRMEVIAPGFTLLEDTYVGAHNKMKVLCPNKHEYLTSWAYLTRGIRCPECANLPKGDIIPYNVLKDRQEWDLETKIKESKKRIKEWYELWNGRVYVAFSGGKDSTVLLSLVRSLYPEVPAVFVNTKLEFPEIVQFVKKTENVTWLKPKMHFKEVIKKYGYPVTSKLVAKKIRTVRHNRKSEMAYVYLTGCTKDGTSRKSKKIPKRWLSLLEAPFNISEQCCDIMKKFPVKKYVEEENRASFVGLLASDSFLRQTNYMKHGCNKVEGSIRISTPLSFWMEKDIWEYLKKYNVPYSKIYNMGYTRTGCTFCMFGIHLENEPNRFQLMKETHPKLWNYCINKLNVKQVLDYIDIPYE